MIPIIRYDTSVPANRHFDHHAYYLYARCGYLSHTFQVSACTVNLYEKWEFRLHIPRANMRAEVRFEFEPFHSWMKSLAKKEA